MRRAIPIVVVILVVAGALFAFFRNRNGNENGEEFTRVTPTRGSISKTVAASGSVTSNLDVEIKCKASGEIIALPFDISDTVSQGDLLVELDPEDEARNVDLADVTLFESQARLDRARENFEVSERDLATSRERARIDLEVAQARADDARASAGRTEDLHERGFISEEEYEQARTEAVASEADVDSANVRFTELDAQEAALELLRQDVRLASASVESARISLQTAQKRLDDTRVYSPMDGIVTARYVQTGQIISSGISTTTGGTTVMMISDLSRLFVLARVDESDIGQVELGQRVKISVDAFPTEEFEGVVDRIAPTGVNISNVVTFEVRIEVTSENKGLLKPEMTADVEIVTEEAVDAVLVPTNAVMKRDGRSTVMVEGEGGRPSPREVVTGIDNGEFTQIVSGLSDTDVVLISGAAESSMWRNQSEERGGPPPGMIGFGRPH